MHSPPTQPHQKTQHIPPPILPFFTPQLFHPLRSPPFHIHFPHHQTPYPPHLLHFQLHHLLLHIQNFQTFQQHFPLNNDTFLKPEIHY
ncbi:acetolactate decarboxylase, partial [Staphylococcus aureus]|uniref:acetolactate decarboxylase n=1 Tax=Staphylococcus aureus TaxID=1280 RepID=UPI0037D99FB9